MNKQCLYFLLLLSFYFTKSQNKCVTLHANWEFKQKGKTHWYKASVPGTLHADLLRNKLIPDPYISENEKLVQWVEKQHWEYRTKFDLAQEDVNHALAELEFYGLDTYAGVYLNDSLILTADNMFRKWTVSINHLLRVGENVLLIRFEAADSIGKNLSEHVPYALPEGSRVFTRKAQFHYGWDFAPRLLGCGIWQPVKIHFISQLKLESVNYLITQLSDSLAQLQFIFESIVEKDGIYTLRTEPLFSEQGIVQANQLEKNLVLKKGVNFDTLLVNIRQPKRWWCNGLGEAYLYKFKCSVFSNGSIQDSKKLSVGLRTIELVQEKDKVGKSFYFKLNGIPVFIKGANLVPADMLYPDSNFGMEFVQLAEEARMNMLRVWGGGIYGSDSFYGVCDSLGIMVWQDFMFACAMYPGDKHFFENTSKEVAQQLKRVRVHPSLALWCGNNEVEEGWKNWGWQKQFKYNKKDSAQIWRNYDTLFHQIIPQLVQTHNPSVNYYASSPSIGWGHVESLREGDSHYWGVWWGMEAFSVYQKRIGRFVSEYGFQSFPDFYTICEFSQTKEPEFSNLNFKNHQKHPKGFEIIDAYLKRDYKEQRSLRNYAYVSQLLQRDGMKLAIEAHRNAKPYCMGTLFWQLNDCWPAISWSCIDFYKRPKALYYQLQRSYAATILTGEFENKMLHVHLISDTSEYLKGKLKTTLVDVKGKVLWKTSVDLAIEGMGSEHLSLNVSDVPDFDTLHTYFLLEYSLNNKTISTNRLFFTLPKYLSLPKATVHLEKIDDYTLRIGSEVFAKDVYVYGVDEYLEMTDNYMDLDPGVQQTIRLRSKKKLPDISRIGYLVLNNL